jgi:uncharacterized surface protein with fasciclin (FAS1) repeats
MTLTTKAPLIGTIIAAGLGLLPHAAMATPINDLLESSEFEIFSAALKQANLWDRITSEDGVTLFLISDEAMRDEGSAFLLGEVLMTESNQQRLVDLMSYHVSFSGPLLPEAFRGEAILTTGAGGCLPVFRLGTGLRVGPEAVVVDVKHVDSGIVYVIDRLLWQPWQDDEKCSEAIAKAE